MMHDEVRQARIDAGLSVMQVARLADVPRKRIYELERGANVTIETLRRIVVVIPNLKRVTLGGMEIVTANADLEEARRAALDLFDVAKRLMAALGASPAPVSSPGTGKTKIEAVHPDRATKSERETAARLEREVERTRRRPRRDA